MLGSAPVAAAPAAPAGLPADVAAQVNNDRISRADLDRMVNSLRDRDVALNRESDEAKAAVAAIRTKILNNLIEQRLLYQEAQRLKISPGRKDIDERMLAFKSGMSETQFNKMLAESGKSAADFRQRVVEALAIEELSKRLTADIVVPQSDIAGYYRDNSDVFMTEEASAHHILFFLKPGATAADRTRQMARAKTVLQQVQARGANFEKIARETSEDPSAKTNNGDLGTFKSDEMTPAFSEAVFDPKTPVGRVSDKIVESPYGFHIIRVDKRTSRPIPIAQARNFIQARLLEKRVKARLEARVEQLRAKANIKRFDS